MTKLGKIRGRARSSFVVFWHISCERSRAAWAAVRNWCFIRKLSYETRTGGHVFKLKNGIDAVLHRTDNKKLRFLREGIKEHAETIPHNKQPPKENYMLQLNCGETPMYLFFSECVSLENLAKMMRIFPERDLWGILFLCDEQAWHRCRWDGGTELETAMKLRLDLKMLMVIYGSRL
jgi:hypothetical protein